MTRIVAARGRAGSAAIAAVGGALVAIVTPAMAQHEHHGIPGGAQVVLTGTARSAAGAPLVGALVQLLHGFGADERLVTTALTDTKGGFAVRAGAGSYTLQISYPGHEPHRQQVTLATTPVTVGSIHLALGPTVLDEVTAQAERVAVELRSGVTVVNVDASAAAGGNMADLLRTIPGIEFDADGRLSMRGSTDVLVLMNGRRIALTGDALVAFLRQMPAAALERVEAGTTVPAGHGADGAAGVVNLVLRTDPGRRTTMRSVAVSMATGDHYLGSAAAAGDAGNALRWDAMYSLSSLRHRADSRTERWSLVPGDLALHTDQSSRGDETHRLHSVLAGTAIAPTPTTSVAVRGAYAWMEGAARNSSAFVYTNTAGNTGTSSTGSRLSHSIPSGELSAVIRLERGVARLTTDARASVVREDYHGAYTDEEAGYQYLGSVMVSRQRERSLRNDLHLRFTGIEAEVGQELRSRTVTATHTATHFDATVSQDYRYDMDLHAGYLTAHRSIGGGRAEAGLRVEADRTRLQLDAATARTAVRAFPSIRGEWADARRGLVSRVAYGRRITRPNAEMLNPFSMGGDDMNAVVGNPSLLPEISDQLEVGIEWHRQRQSLQLTPYVRWTRDPVRQIKRATASGGTTTRLENLVRMHAIGADGSVRAQLTESAIVTLAGGVAHLATTGDGFGSSGVYATARLTIDVRVTGNTTAQVYAYGRTAQAIEQGEIRPAFTTELALTQQLAGDRSRVTLRLIDPLRSDRLAFRIADPAFTQQSRRRTARPLLSLFASYAVGGGRRDDAPVRAEGPARIF